MSLMELKWRRWDEVVALANSVGCVPATTQPKGFLDDPTGWRVHFVEGDDSIYDTRRRSLCGLYPRHGWGLDNFIQEPCKRCEARAKKMSANPNRRTDI